MNHHSKAIKKYSVKLCHLWLLGKQHCTHQVSTIVNYLPSEDINSSMISPLIDPTESRNIKFSYISVYIF